MSSIFSINQDSFIYAVRQSLDARHNLKTGFNSHLKYIPFLDNTWEKPKDANLKALIPLLKDIVTHHWNAIPHYKRREAVNLENISWFAHSIACLYADMAFVFRETLEHEFLEQNEDSKEFWETVNSLLNDIYKEYALLFHSYTDWKHSPKTQQEASIDWNVRPPCGLLYRTQFKELFDEMRESRYGKRQSHSSQQQKDKKPHHNQNSSSANTPTDTYASSKRSRDMHRKRDDRNKEEDNHFRKSSESELNAARDECLNAIQTMQKNKKIPEIPLSAQNSFIRREQHTLITEAGFYTDSRGEGGNRHVCILRDQV